MLLFFIKENELKKFRFFLNEKWQTNEFQKNIACKNISIACILAWVVYSKFYRILESMLDRSQYQITLISLRNTIFLVKFQIQTYAVSWNRKQFLCWFSLKPARTQASKHIDCYHIYSPQMFEKSIDNTVCSGDGITKSKNLHFLHLIKFAHWLHLATVVVRTYGIWIYIHLCSFFILTSFCGFAQRKKKLS